jgi:aryl-phospho-beta-D-glucosidase BglC (GH1 family)
MKKLIKTLSVLFTVLLCTNAYTQGFLHCDGKKIVDGSGNEVILKGLNFGNSMVQEGYMMNTADYAGTQHQVKAKLKTLLGDSLMNVYYRTWLKNHVQKSDLQLLKKWGMNSVRIPIHYEYFTSLTEDVWYDWGFTFLDSIVKWCSQEQIYAIIDLHAAPGGQGEDAAISDYDNTKPSLWESMSNKNKTVALWQKIAQRYKDEPWVGGYDLINETNWYKAASMGSKNDSLAVLMKRITKAVRSVDTVHIVFIEGNGYANDYNGLTPAWDKNMAYSFHKYWSTNQQSTIQWVINLRNAQNVPIWCGETGENSNTHYTREMELFNQQGIGVAWWPMKKFESVNSFVICKWPTNYSKIQSYLKSGTAIDKKEAFDILMQMAENLKLENTTENTGMFYAIMKQPGNTETIPFTDNHIPGLIPFSTYDIGLQGYTYSDEVFETTASGSGYTAWNSGWAFRNDGVDLEACTDVPYTNGYSLGWTAKGEWSKYTLTVDSTGVYDVIFRVASASSNTGGIFHLENSKGENITGNIIVASTGSWSKWASDTAYNVRLTKGKEVLKLVIDRIDGSGFNINSMLWGKPKDIAKVPVRLMSAQTNADGDTIVLQFNNGINQTITVNTSDFTLSGGTGVSIDKVITDNKDLTKIYLIMSGEIMSDNVLTLSYSGTSIADTGKSVLPKFSNIPVLNTMLTRSYIPGKIEAESFIINNGLSIETCTDTNGGKSLGYTDAGDYLEYLVYVKEDGDYVSSFRIAADNSSAGIGAGELALYDNGTKEVLCKTTFKRTGGWQKWDNVTSSSFHLTKGKHTLRFTITSKEFNINYFTISQPTGINEVSAADNAITVYPNPTDGNFRLQSTKNIGSVQIFDLAGKTVYSKSLQQADNQIVSIDLDGFPKGMYVLKALTASECYTQKIVLR